MSVFHPDGLHRILVARSLEDLRGLGASKAVLDALGWLVASGYDERAVVVVFLHLLAEGPSGAGLGRQVRRVIEQAYRGLEGDPASRTGLRDALLRALPLAASAGSQSPEQHARETGNVQEPCSSFSTLTVLTRRST